MPPQQRIMKSKYFFEEFKDQIKEEHQAYETHLEEKEHNFKQCDHKGKVKIINGTLKCSCGAGWSGPQLNVLFDFFNKK